MEVGILEKYRGNPLPLLEGGPDGFQCLQIEVPVEDDMAAYDVQGPCKPGTVWKGRV